MNITVNVLSNKIQKQNLCICMLHIYGLFLIIYIFFLISFEILKY